jgi:hypothetical protein
MLLLVAGLPATSWAAKNIPWRTDLFERTSFEEDIKDVLRVILRQNGLQVIFRPGVDGQVTFEFANLPLEAAFNKLLAEHNLDYDFDESTRLVTVFPAKTQQSTRAFMPLAEADPASVLAAARRFGIGGRYDVDQAAPPKTVARARRRSARPIWRRRRPRCGANCCARCWIARFAPIRCASPTSRRRGRFSTARSSPCPASRTP